MQPQNADHSEEEEDTEALIKHTSHHAMHQRLHGGSSEHRF